MPTIFHVLSSFLVLQMGENTKWRKKKDWKDSDQ